MCFNLRNYTFSASDVKCRGVNELPQVAVQCIYMLSAQQCTTAHGCSTVRYHSAGHTATSREPNRRVIAIPSCATGWPPVSTKPSASSCKTSREKSSSRADSLTRFGWNDSLVSPGFPQVNSLAPSPKENVRSYSLGYG